MVTETDVPLSGGRTLHAYDAAPGGPGDRLAVFWHHGTPNVGAPPEPLFEAADRLGIRWVSHDRPGYGGSTPHPGRDVASVAADVAAVADALGIGQFAVMGHSGGGPHALACATLLPDRVLATVCGSGLAPVGSPGLDWFAGMSAGGSGELAAATQGRSALERHLETTEFDPEMFTAADEEALEGPWAWLAGIAGLAMRGGLDGMVDDDLATVAPWGFDPATAPGPVLFLHGADDRMVPVAHSQWLAAHVPGAELWVRPGQGHVSVLGSDPEAMAWLVENARARTAGT